MPSRAVLHGRQKRYTLGASNEITRIYCCPADGLRVDAAGHRQSGQSNLNATTNNEQYVPRLGDIMNAVQSRHIKLWFAGKARNWELAAYELRQLKAGLVEAAVLYEGIPVTNVTTMAKPVQSISDAIEAKDGKRFAKAVGELTDGCNACHQVDGTRLYRHPDAERAALQRPVVCAAARSRRPTLAVRARPAGRPFIMTIRQSALLALLLSAGLASLAQAETPNREQIAAGRKFAQPRLRRLSRGDAATRRTSGAGAARAELRRAGAAAVADGSSRCGNFSLRTTAAWVRTRRCRTRAWRTIRSTRSSRS